MYTFSVDSTKDQQKKTPEINENVFRAQTVSLLHLLCGAWHWSLYLFELP